jgi:hypothetical protein
VVRLQGHLPCSYSTPRVTYSRVFFTMSTNSLMAEKALHTNLHNTPISQLDHNFFTPISNTPIFFTPIFYTPIFYTPIFYFTPISTTNQLHYLSPSTSYTTSISSKQSITSTTQYSQMNIHIYIHYAQLLFNTS